MMGSLPFPYLEEILWLQEICVTTRHHNILQIFVALNILKYSVPTCAAWLLWSFRDCISACTDCVRPGAESTVYWTDRGSWPRLVNGHNAGFDRNVPKNKALPG